MKYQRPLMIGMFVYILLIPFYSISQVDQHHQHSISEKDQLGHLFSDYEIFTEDLDDELNYLSQNEKIELAIPYKSGSVQLYLYKNYLLSEDYLSRSATGLKNNERPVTMDGYTRSGDIASITLAKDFIFGFFENEKGEKIYVEPLRFHLEEAANDQFILVNQKDILDTTGGTCGTTDRHNLMNNMRSLDEEEHQHAEMAVGGCLEVEYAIASDFLMFQKYGTVVAVENRNIGVVNDVQTNFNTDFDDTLKFTIVEQFVSDCSSCDPWTNSTDAGVLLSDFTSWGPTGFSVTHDVATLWTDRNFNGGTIGIAWVGSVCTSNRYNCCQDFSSNSDLIRVLTAHELGHNFDATHDAAGSPYIMAPAVQNTNQWSTQSMNQINSYLGGISCLANCPSTGPTVAADFGVIHDNLCDGTTVKFYDKSSGPVATYDWTFPGGSPGSSTAQNPSVTYSSPGVYDVILTVDDGAGSSDTRTKTAFITVGAGGNNIKAFEDFEDGSTGSWSASGNQSWSITTEDGVQYGDNTFMVDNFSSGGEVDLESPVIDLLGHDVATLNINYSYATRNGNSDSLVVYISTDGGNTFTREAGYAENGSGNYATAPNTNGFFAPLDSNDWCHGPGNACLQVPLDNATQSQNVVVKITNKSFGGNNLYIDYVYVSTDCYELFPPIADFTANVQQGCNSLSVMFEDLSLENPVEWEWSFPGGDPASSTQQNPNVFYPAPGVYSVQLTAINPAGQDTETKVDYIFVEADPTAFFTYTVNGREVTFTNESTEAFNYTWDFGDGNSSNAENPIHTYNQDGTFTVTLTSSNNCSADTYTEDIVIATPPVAAFTASDSMGCQPLEIIFDANSSQNTTAYYWEFPGGTPSTGSDVVETVTYDSAGTFDVLFVASNANFNDTILLEDYIVIDPLPQASFTYTELNLEVNFESQSEDADSLLWHFGDGNTSTMVNPTHTYDSAGTYVVLLEAINNCGIDTMIDTLTVQEALTAIIESSATEGCIPFEVTFDGTNSPGATSYNWTFEGGSPATSTQDSLTVEYDSAGTFDVTLIVSDSAGSDTTVLTDYISVNTTPSGDFDFSVSGREVSFQLNASNYDSLIWHFGDGDTSYAENPVHEYSQDGTYEVILTLINECGNIQIINDIMIATPPLADFDYDVTEGCIPLEVNFTNNSSENASSFAWTFEGGDPGTSTMENPTVTYSSAGSYNVQLIAISNGGRDTLEITDLITVLPDPDADFDFETDTTSVQFTNTSTNADSFFWDFGDGNNSTMESPSHTYAMEGSYTVRLEAYNECDTNIFTREIGVGAIPTADFDVQGSTEGCVPYIVQFTNNSTGTVDSFVWTFEGGIPATSHEENPTVSYNLVGSFDVSLKVINSAGENVLLSEDYIEINDKPTGTASVVVSDSLTVNFTGTVSDPAATVRWEFGDGNTSNQKEVLYTYQEDGTYEVLYIVMNECGSDTTVQEIMVGSTSASNPYLKQIRVYPNPALESFTIDRLPIGASLNIIDPYGHLILDREIRSSEMRIEASSWSSGVYYINIRYQDDSEVFRMIIQN